MDDITRRKYYDAFFDMYATDGWRTFMQEMKERKEDIERTAVYSASDEKSLYRIKGVVETLNSLIGHEQSIRDEEAFMRDTDDDPL